MKGIMGPKMGYFSNLVVFFHTFGSVVSLWLFSFDFLSKGVKEVIYNEGEGENFDIIFKYGFFASLFLVIYISSIAGKIDFLKKLSLLSLLIILYMLFVLVFQLPTYFDYNNNI